MGAVSSTNTPQWYVDDPSGFTTPGLPSKAAQGQSCAGTKFTGVYDDSAEDLLYTDAIDFTGMAQAWMRFEAFYDLETYSDVGVTYAADGVRLLATPDVGQSWYLITPDQGYPFQYVDAFVDPAGNPAPGWSGNSGGWHTITVDLTPLLQQSKNWIFAWEFASDFSIGRVGFFLDDVRIFGAKRVETER